MINKEVIYRLRTAESCKDVFGERVYSLKNLFRLDLKEHTEIPALFVLPPTMTSPVPPDPWQEPSRFITTVTVPILLYLGAYAEDAEGLLYLDDRGEESVLSLQIYEEAVAKALLGWIARPGYGAMVPGGYSMVETTNSRILYQLDWIAMRDMSFCCGQISVEEQEQYDEDAGGVFRIPLEEIGGEMRVTSLPEEDPAKQVASGSSHLIKLERFKK